MNINRFASTGRSREGAGTDTRYEIPDAVVRDAEFRWTWMDIDGFHPRDGEFQHLNRISVAHTGHKSHADIYENTGFGLFLNVSREKRSYYTRSYCIPRVSCICAGYTRACI